MTPRYVTSDIPVYPLVKKFLAFHYATDPFEISNISNPYSSYLYACLDRYDYRDTLLPKKYERLTDRLTIGVAAWRIKSFGSGQISPVKVSAFNDFVKQLFFEKLTNEVSMRMAFGDGMRSATERVMNRYGITEDELPMDTALRYYARYRRKHALEYCPAIPTKTAVILPHERDCADGQVESGWRAVA